MATKKSFAEMMMEDYNEFHAQPDPDLGNGVVASDMGAMGILPRKQRPVGPTAQLPDGLTVPEGETDLGNGVIPSDLGAMGILPRNQRPPPEELPASQIEPAATGVMPPAQIAEALGPAVPPVPAVPSVPPVPAWRQGVQSLLTTPRMFKSSRGPDGAFNMGADAPEGSVQTNWQGVPLGQRMVPVRGLSGGRASVGVPEASTVQEAQMGSPIPESTLPIGDMGNLDAVASQSPLIRALTNSGVIKATAAETNTLRRMQRGTFDAGTANTRGRMLQDQEQGLEQGRMAADQAASRQIAVARGTPQGVGSPAGNSTWDPVNQRWETDMRPSTASRQVVEGEERRKNIETYSKAIRALDGGDMSQFVSTMMGAQINAANGDKEKIKAIVENWNSFKPDAHNAATLKEQLQKMLQDEQKGAAVGQPVGQSDGKTVKQSDGQTVQPEKKKRTLGGVAPTQR
jgi:hypothetical protein